MDKITTFIALSGGVDSTYYLWKWLSENPKNKGESILIHHVLLHQARKQVEKVACDKILKYLTSQGMTNYQYVETVFSRGTLRGSLYDLPIVGLISGCVISTKSCKYLTTILGCYCREESPKTVRLIGRGKTFREACNTMPDSRQSQFIKNIEYINKKTYSYESPYILKSKMQMIDELPQELREAVWFCRLPKNNNPCKRCFNCRRVLPHLKKYVCKQ